LLLERCMMNKRVYGIAAALMALLIATAVVYWPDPSPAPPAPRPLPDSITGVPPGAASAPPEALPRYPIEAVIAEAAASGASAVAPAEPVAGRTVESALVEWLGRPAVLTHLQLDGFVQRVVATVDNLPRGHAAPRLWPVNPAPGRFTTEPAAGPSGVIAGANAARYAPFVDWVTAVDSGRAVAMYLRLYPQLQEAYEELGYPGRHFNDRVVEVIDHLLATPEPADPPAVVLTEVKGPVVPARPWVLYEFADPDLRALSAGQKMLLRVGADHRQRLKARLADFRAHLTAAAARR
jgi:hypothetical protein